MAVFLSKSPRYPYQVVSVEGEFRNPIELDITKNADNKADRKETRVYIVISGENVSQLRVYADNQIVPGISILIAKDNQGNPMKYEYQQVFTNLNAKDENRDLVIPIWLKVVVDKDVVNHGLYQNNLLKIDYQN